MTFPTDKQIREAVLVLLRAKKEWIPLMLLLGYINKKFDTNVSPVAVISVLNQMISKKEIQRQGDEGSEQSQYRIVE